MTTMRMKSLQVMMWTRHNANVLHVYCRLMDLGLSRKWAGRLARTYEVLTHWIIY